MQNFGHEVSVVIPAFNPGKFLDEALESVRSQDCQAGEIIVIDDGSTPPVSVEKFGDPPIRLLRQANAGQAAARNLGIRESRGNWVAFLDADDVWHPKKIGCQLRVAAKNPDLSIIGCRAPFIDSAGNCIGAGRGAVSGTTVPLDRSQFQRDAPRAILVPSMALVSRAAAVSIGGFELRYQPIEDLAFFDRLFQSGAKAVVVERVLLKRRLHGESLTMKYGPMLSSYLRWIDERVRPGAAPSQFEFVQAQAYLVTGLSALAGENSRQARVLLKKGRVAGAALKEVLLPFLFTFFPPSFTKLARRIKQFASGRKALLAWFEVSTGSTSG